MGVTIRILENPNTKRNNVLNKKTRKIEVTYMIEFLVYNFFVVENYASTYVDYIMIEISNFTINCQF